MQRVALCAVASQQKNYSIHRVALCEAKNYSYHMEPEVLFGLFERDNSCILCGNYVCGTAYIIDHFITCHHLVFKGENYIWAYKEDLMCHNENTLYEIRSSSITVKFPHLVLLKWEFCLKDLIRMIGQNSPIKRNRTRFEIEVREIVDADRFDNILLSQSYSCMLCNVKFTVIPTSEVLYSHLIKCMNK